MKPLTRKKALELLRTDIKKWNEYRDQRGFVPDLSGANLSGANLSGANLSDAKLDGANLSDAKLDGANLTAANLMRAELTLANLTGTDLLGAVLRNSNLAWADLEGAELQDVDFTGANLTEAKLIGASLIGASLVRANLNKTKFDGAILDGAKFSQTMINFDLSGPAMLNNNKHWGESFVSHKSLRSCGKEIPTKFLRGCGLTDLEIELIPSISGAAINYYSGFISYSHKDEEFARRLYSDLQDAGVRCWYAPEDMKIGDRPLKAIGEAIRLRDKLILILSEESINSDWVEHEVTKALEEEAERGKDVLFPVRIDHSIMAAEFGWAKRIREAHRPEGRHIGDFERWKDHDAYKATFDRLLRDLKATTPTAP